jgi:hypothetical protein
MKYIITIIGFIFLSACNVETYTSNKYFDCSDKEFTASSDQQQLVYAVLERSFVTIKDSPDYRMITDKKNIYLNRAYYSAFSASTKYEIKDYQFQDNEVPAKINDVRFCLKSTTEMQKIADNTSDFYYMTITDIKIDENIATIEISSSRQQTQASRRKAMYGGSGHKLQYKKVDGKWVFDRVISISMS